MGRRHGRAVTLAAALAAAAVVGCRRGEDDVAVRDRARTESAQKAAMATFGDESVISAMRTPDTLGRIIYDKPPDLSLASAQLRRPDIFKAPTPAPAGAPGKAAAPGTTPQRRDTTAGDATRDTSGGAARRPRQRP